MCVDYIYESLILVVDVSDTVKERVTDTVPPRDSSPKLLKIFPWNFVLACKLNFAGERDYPLWQKKWASLKRREFLTWRNIPEEILVLVAVRMWNATMITTPLSWWRGQKWSPKRRWFLTNRHGWYPENNLLIKWLALWKSVQLTGYSVQSLALR